MERLAHTIKDAVQDGSWRPFQVGGKGPKISHLFFADDLVLFDESSPHQMNIMLTCLKLFYGASRAKVSVLKTKLFCSRNTTTSTGVELSRISGFERVDNLDKYLGVQLFHGQVSKTDYSYIAK